MSPHIPSFIVRSAILSRNLPQELPQNLSHSFISFTISVNKLLKASHHSRESIQWVDFLLKNFDTPEPKDKCIVLLAKI
jgi:hypothetical protein